MLCNSYTFIPRQVQHLSCFSSYVIYIYNYSQESLIKDMINTKKMSMCDSLWIWWNVDWWRKYNFLSYKEIISIIWDLAIDCRKPSKKWNVTQKWEDTVISSSRNRNRVSLVHILKLYYNSKTLPCIIQNSEIKSELFWNCKLVNFVC